MGNKYLDSVNEGFGNVLSHFESELRAIRTGRASVSLVESIKVEAYGTAMNMLEIASISALDPRQLAIQPYDISLIKSVEKAIFEYGHGLTPAVDGNVVRVNIPHLTEERRTELSKIVRIKAEEARVSLRHLRERAKETIESDFKNKILREDDKFRFVKELDDKLAEFNGKIKEISDRKEEEIKTL